MGSRLLCGSVSGLLGVWGLETRRSVWRHFPVLAFQILAACLCIFWSPSAGARTHAGLCSPTAESMEAPPPIYPSAETFARGCETPEKRSALSSPTPERPLPLVQLKLDCAKAIPVAPLGVAGAPSTEGPDLEQDQNLGFESTTRPPRPPRN